MRTVTGPRVTETSSRLLKFLMWTCLIMGRLRVILRVLCLPVIGIGSRPLYDLTRNDGPFATHFGTTQRKHGLGGDGLYRPFSAINRRRSSGQTAAAM